jgi:hypothetical protein
MSNFLEIFFKNVDVSSWLSYEVKDTPSDESKRVEVARKAQGIRPI